MKSVRCGIRKFLEIFRSLKNVGLFFLVLVIIPNIRSLSLSGVELLGKLFDLFLGFTTFSQVSTVLISILFGLNLVIFKEIRSRDVETNKKTKTATTGGILFGVLGAGCGACGILAVSFLSFFGLGSLVAVLPLGGVEFEIAGIVLLAVSLILILSQLIDKNNCKVNYEK